MGFSTANARFYLVLYRVCLMASWLGRFLVTCEWEELFSNLVQEVLSCSTSDHFPILLEYNSVHWGPTPFRFKNLWLLHPFLLMHGGVHVWWMVRPILGLWRSWNLKDKLRVWNVDVFGDMRVKLWVGLGDLPTCLERVWMLFYHLKFECG